MPAHQCKQHFPQPADGQRDEIGGQKIQKAVQQTGGQVVRSQRHAQRLQRCCLPVQVFCTGLCDGEIGLQAGVVPAEQNAREGCQHDVEHQAFQVDGIAHVRGAHGFLTGRIQKGVDHFKKRIELFQPCAGLEGGFNAVKELSQAHAGYPSCSIWRRFSRRIGA